MTEQKFKVGQNVIGADGLINDVPGCTCRVGEHDFMGGVACSMCVPARLVNSELVPMEEE